MPITKAQIKKWRSMIGRAQLEKCLEQLQDVAGELPPSMVNMIIHFQGRFAELKKQERLGTLSHQSANTERNRIVAAVLELLGEIEQEIEAAIKKDRPSKRPSPGAIPRMEEKVGSEPMVYPELELEEKMEDAMPPSSPAPSQQPKQEGAILYRIPSRMQVKRESRCIVRLAFDEKTVKRGMENAEDVVLKSVRVEEVMEVELLDPNSPPAFEIRAITDREQLVEESSFTEWIFKVKPLREGSYPILLKISVVLFINGKDRKKNIVLEEMVEVATVPVADAPGTGRFKTYDPTLEELPGAPMFISWSRTTEDAAFKKDFEKHLSILRRRGFLHYWDPTKAHLGEMTADILRDQLSRAVLFAVLISPDYLSDDQCYQELAAIQRQEKNREAVIVPILLRDCSYDLLDIGRLQVLPRSGTPIAQHSFPDEVWKEVIREIYKLAQLLGKTL